MRWYACIDLKSFYASVECVERGLDPLTAHVLVADEARTDKTICLAVSPALKAYGIPSRARLFEAKQAIARADAARRTRAPRGEMTGEAFDSVSLAEDASAAIGFIAAPPRMALYMDYSTRVYDVYLRHMAPEDIHVYSVDEVFADLTPYLKASGESPETMVSRMVRDVQQTTGIPAAAGIGTNLYLAKVAMDILAKHASPDAHGVRIARLTEEDYRRRLWTHRPLTDFWRVGRGYAHRLAEYRLYTMGDVARCSLRHEDLLYRLFGVNAELLIDHAWGIEPCTLADVKAYRPTVNSLTSGQVLSRPYTAAEARLIVREMTEAMALDLVSKGLLTDQLALQIGYDTENLSDPTRCAYYRGEVSVDAYGRRMPRHTHGTAHVVKTSSTKELCEAVLALYDKIVQPGLTVRRLNLTAARVIREAEMAAVPEQLTLFEEVSTAREARLRRRRRERAMQEALLWIKGKYGNNAVFKGMDLFDEATALERNRQIGGHKA